MISMGIIGELVVYIGGAAFMASIGYAVRYLQEKQPSNIRTCDTCKHLKYKGHRREYHRYKCGCDTGDYFLETGFDKPRQYCKYYEKREG